MIIESPGLKQFSHVCGLSYVISAWLVQLYKFKLTCPAFLVSWLCQSETILWVLGLKAWWNRCCKKSILERVLSKIQLSVAAAGEVLARTFNFQLQQRQELFPSGGCSMVFTALFSLVIQALVPAVKSEHLDLSDICEFPIHPN